MQGLILAAGMGTRLKTLTQSVPKVMIKVNNKPLIMQSLERLYEQGVTETVIVVGYKKECIIDGLGSFYKDMKLTYVENSVYETTNNVYSLYCAAPYLNEDFLLVEGDLLYSRELLDKAVARKNGCNIVVSRYNPETMNGTVIRAKGDKAVELVVKKRQPADFDYSDVWKTVNIYYFSKEFAQKYFELLSWYIKNGSLNNYYEFVLGALLYYGEDDIRIIPVDEKEWFEIDDEKDLEIARQSGGF
jgi:choline kinase